jgi:hypothetical protein
MASNTATLISKSLPGDYHIGYDSGAESQYESDVDAIRAAGIKVKE